jgi:hypothetical protein
MVCRSSDQDPDQQPQDLAMDPAVDALEDHHALEQQLRALASVPKGM